MHSMPMQQGRRRSYTKIFSIKRQQARTEWIKELSYYLSQPHTPCGAKQIILKTINQLLEPSANDDTIIEMKHRN
jgi:hypothetical protein